MYIPFGPSKKQLYKIILLLLCLLFGFKSCAKALTTTEFTNNGTWIDTSIDAGNNKTSVRFLTTTGVKNIFTGFGEGYVLFTFQTSSYSTNVTSQLTEVNAISSNGINVCEIGTTNGYLDSQNQIITWTAKCPLNLSGNNNLIRISWTRGGPSGKLDIRLGSVIAFVSKDSASSSSVIEADLSTIQQYQIDINNNISQFKNATHQDLENIKNALSNNNTIIQNIQNNTSDIKDSINNDNVDNNQANSFFNDFNSNTPQGLVSLINKPLDFLNGLYNECTPIMVHVPYFDFDLTLPCISSIHNGIFDIIIPIAKIIINGLICYRLVIGFINIINKLKDPNESDIEVVDL